MRQGLVQVYTGNGKGKTTAAIGCALRAAGSGLKVCIIQFMKQKDSGELKVLEKIDNIDIKQFGTSDFVKRGEPHGGEPHADDFKAAEMGLDFFKEIMNNRVYDLIILDEINSVLDYELLSVWELIEAIENKPASTELILTGRDAPQEVLRLADLVTEMIEIKHYYNEGIEARKGIEY